MHGVTRSPWVPLGSVQAELRFFQQVPRLDSGDPVLSSALKVQPEDVSESIRGSAGLRFNPMLSHSVCKLISKCIYIFFPPPSPQLLCTSVHFRPMAAPSGICAEGLTPHGPGGHQPEKIWGKSYYCIHILFILVNKIHFSI